VATFIAQHGGIVIESGVDCDGGTVTDLPIPFLATALRAARPSKYLVYHAGGGVGGFGSRLNGIANVFLWSLLTKRTFTIEYDTPHPLADCFTPALPALVDWTKKAPKRRKTEYLVDRTLPKRLLEHGDIEESWKGHGTVAFTGANMPCMRALSTNPHYDLSGLGIPGPCDTRSSLRDKTDRRFMDTRFQAWKALAWRTLFRPSAAVLAVAKPTLDRMRTFDTTIAIHIREGGTFGGAHDASRSHGASKGFKRQAVMQWFLDCASAKTKQAQAQNKSVAWFIASDHVELEQWMAKKATVPVLSLGKNRAVHTDKSHQSEKEWLETAADWIVLGEAMHIIVSPSTFSFTAALYAGKVPTMWGEDCG